MAQSGARIGIDQKVLDFIHHAAEADPGEEAFTKLALDLFAYQYERNPAYRMFCMKDRGAGPSTPDRIRSWKDIPAVPVGAFRAAPFCGFAPDRAVQVFETSGTTGRAPGRHYFDTLDLYDESALPNFSRYLLPDDAHLPMRMLMPAPAENPKSSLSYMCRIVAEAFGEDAEWFVRDGKMDVSGILADLDRAAKEDRPRMILGTAFAFVHLIDVMAEKGLQVRLPAGSRIMETGGYKGRSREMTADQLHAHIETFLGVPRAWIVNEYGMTELSSQMYDDTLRHAVQSTAAPAADSERLVLKIPPPWVKIQIADPVSLEPAPYGTPGIVRIWDLANRGSAVAVQTGDLGIAAAAGFQVLGRNAGADMRGCSLQAEDMTSPSIP
ncbi:hypothetical protein HY522_05230 [bacterium]|nr:hypothetical protein [bacterium]